MQSGGPVPEAPPSLLPAFIFNHIVDHRDAGILHQIAVLDEDLAKAWEHTKNDCGDNEYSTPVTPCGSLKFRHLSRLEHHIPNRFRG